ncbi:MAG: PilZ domain-containing protein [Pseudomonadota bacterium]
MSDPNKRVHPRADFKIAVKVEHLSRLQQFYSQDLSSGGIFLEVPGKPPEIGAKLRLQFQVPGIKKPIVVDAEVMHQHTFQLIDPSLRKKVARHGIGLRFLNLDPKDAELIQKHVTGKDLSVDH